MTTKSDIQLLLDTRTGAKELLDDLVREHADQMASEINRESLLAQLEFLRSQRGVRMHEVYKHLDEGTADADKDVMVIVTFHPQRWGGRKGDICLDADPQGPTTFEVTRFDVMHKTPRSGSADELKYHRNAPKWIREWDGPFEIDWEVKEC